MVSQAVLRFRIPARIPSSSFFVSQTFSWIPRTATSASGGRAGAVQSRSFVYRPPRRKKRWHNNNKIFIQKKKPNINNKRKTIDTTRQQPVVIVGGGPSGLLMLHLLTNYNIPSILFEQQTVEARFKHPQAHFLNTRTMEILRHYVPVVYQRVRAAMPPVQQWKSFRFGASMSSQPPLAEVIHPVDIPLQFGVDANGVLKELAEDEDYDSSYRRTSDLSPCTVGHLAQHTFGRILYDYALERASRMTQIKFNTRVVKVERVDKEYKIDKRRKRKRKRKASTDDDGDDGDDYEKEHQDEDDSDDEEYDGRPAERIVHVTTEDGTVYTTDLVVAADGASSFLRANNKHGNIDMVGQEAMQHLINIHVKLSPEAAARLHANDNHAMLYSVYSDKVVAMVVCHSVGEYIVQIPYFPPYQTVEEDFGPQKLPEILGAIFGPVVSPDDWNVLTVKSWTMSSLIASQYYSNDEAIVLVGDAAHVFPPAGGFGMNTGLQDVHNLAWKIAAYRGGGRKEGVLARLLVAYENERRSIAQRNAALSVRNYNRLLELSKSVYLDEQHPTLLQSMLDKAPIVSLETKQTIFRTLLEAALYPFSWIKPPETATTGSDEEEPVNPLYAHHIQSNLLESLRSGAGLPLLFPKFELDLNYGIAVDDPNEVEDKSKKKKKKKKGNYQWADDTIPEEPTLRAGRLVPHVPVKVVSGGAQFPNLQYMDDEKTTISTVDLPGQMARTNQPTFVLLWVTGDGEFLRGKKDRRQVTQLYRLVTNAIRSPVALVALISDNAVAAALTAGAETNPKTDQAASSAGALVVSTLKPKDDNSDEDDDDDESSPVAFSFRDVSEYSYMALIRPDGHVMGFAIDLEEPDDVKLDKLIGNQ